MHRIFCGFFLFLVCGASACGVKGGPTPYIETHPDVPPVAAPEVKKEEPVPAPIAVPETKPKGKAKKKPKK